MEEDKDVSLSCNSKCNPQGHTAWFKDKQSLALQQGRHELYQSTELFRLSIRKVHKSDNGTYTCVVQSPLGNGTRHFHLIVEGNEAAARQ